MIKLLWYIYFIIFLIIYSVTTKIKLYFLRKKSFELADKYVYEKMKTMANHIIKKSKTKTEVTGLENIPNETCLFVCNHQAMFDGFLLLANINNISGFIAKKEIKKIPLVRSWLSAIHTIYIDRSNIREGMKAINKGVENLKKGYSMIIFPEGTRSLSSTMGEFKKGSMKLALKANVPVVPITIDGTYRILEVGNVVRGHKVKMTIHEPIYLDNLTQLEKKNLSEKVYHIIQNALV